MPHTIQQLGAVGLALDLCDRGRYREAADVLGSYREDAEYLLAAGTIASHMGSLEQMRGAQEDAKDLLTKSARLFGQSERRADALGMLALCYWRCGETSEALITVDQAISVSPTSFRALLVRAIIRTDQDNLTSALETLKQIDTETLSIAQRGRFHIQRALIYRAQAQKQNRTKAEATRDRAIIEYQAAAVCFEESGHLSGLAAVTNNLAGLYLDCKRIPEAHENANRAIVLWEGLGDQGQLAQAFDQKARIYLKEHKSSDALVFASRAVALLEKGDQKAWLAGIEVTKTRAEIMKRNEDEERELIRKALVTTEGCTTNAATLLGLSQPGLAFKIAHQYPELLPLRKEPRTRRPRQKIKLFRK